MRTSCITTTGVPCCAVSESGGDGLPGIRISPLPSVEAVAEVAAQALLEACREEPRRPLGLATGRTMVPVYRALVGQVSRLSVREREEIRLRWWSFNLDEYVGLGPAEQGSFAAEMHRNLSEPLGIDADRVLLPDGLAKDPEEEARRYSEALHRAGGIGLQILGLGLNGHVGFNEPPCEEHSPTRCVELCATTRQANASAFNHDLSRVPTRAITLGLSDILAAQRILLVVTGSAKAPILKRLLETSPSSDLPASWLHHHPSVQLLADPSALEA